MGYKVHLTETCDADAPHLIVEVLATPAPRPDNNIMAEIHESLSKKDLLPSEHMADAGYVDAGQIIESREKHGVELVGPVPADTSRQARAGEGFSVSEFKIDWDRHVAECPEGKESACWSEGTNERGEAVVQIRFGRDVCQACKSGPKCKNGKNGRSLKLRKRAEHETLQTARKYQETPDFKERYNIRAGVEGTVAQATGPMGMRQTRYFGLRKTTLQTIGTAVAINLKRAVDWFTGKSPAKTRVSALAFLPRAA